MKDVVVVTPPDARPGFVLAGVRQAIVPAADAAPAALRELLRDRSIGVLVVDERLVTQAMRSELHVLESSWPGVVVVLPAPESVRVTEEDYVLQLIRRAIGYQVRLT